MNKTLKQVKAAEQAKQQKQIKKEPTPIQIDPLLLEIRALVERYKGKSTITYEENKEMFRLHNIVWPGDQQHNYSCSICSINVFSKLKRYAES